MGRRPKKENLIDKAGLKFIIENTGKLSTAGIGRKLGYHHTTIMYYQRKLRKAGFNLPRNQAYSLLDPVIEELKEEYNIN